MFLAPHYKEVYTMGMVVRTNVMAVNAFRQLNMNNSQVGKSLEKLSSGFRINRAGDDASGLAISEKMKAQIKGLETASANSQDGISLVQTAEGALTEVHDMLNRMVELAGKAANGTMDENVDRKALQEEMNALKEEINRIADGTNFNGIKLLDGSLGGGAKAGAVNLTVSGQSAHFEAPVAVNPVAAKAETTAAITASHAGFEFSAKGADGTVITIKDTDCAGFNAGGSPELNAKAIVDALNANATFSKDFTASVTSNDKITFEAKSGFDLAMSDLKFGTNTTSGNATANQVNAGGTAGKAAATTMKIQTNLANGDKFTIGGKTYEMAAAADAKTGKFSTFDELKTQLAANGIEMTGTAQDLNANTVLTFKAGAPAAGGDAGNGLVLQIGDTAENFNQITVSIDDMSTKGLGIENISVESREQAADALKALRDVETGGGAINVVSAQRAKLGALQNRLEHTINNLDVAAENMTSANMRIRDADMAKEMMSYTKMNVLTQAAQAMLAQANQQPQSVLQLLQ